MCMQHLALQEIVLAADTEWYLLVRILYFPHNY
jgi:hypothetical protein